MDADPLQPAYVLHTRRFQDSSLIVDLLTREHGRLAGLAKGVLRARRANVRIQPFQPLLIELRGRGEVPILSRTEPAGPSLSLTGRAIYCGIYLNELVLKLTARQDPYPALFDDYAEALAELAARPQSEPVLRWFELRLLGHLGLGMPLSTDDRGEAIVDGRAYLYDVTDGPRHTQQSGPDVIRGVTLVALREGRLEDPEVLREARQLMRRVINFHLGGQTLRSRELFR